MTPYPDVELMKAMDKYSQLETLWQAAFIVFLSFAMVFTAAGSSALLATVLIALGVLSRYMEHWTSEKCSEEFDAIMVPWFETSKREKADLRTEFLKELEKQAFEVWAKSNPAICCSRRERHEFKMSKVFEHVIKPAFMDGK